MHHPYPATALLVVLVASTCGCEQQEPTVAEVAEAPAGTVPVDRPFGPDESATAAPPPATAPASGEVDPDGLPGDPIDGELVETDSGLMYYDFEVGDGDLPTGDEVAVQVDYHGWHLDGKKFDSSIDRGEPADFLLAAVVPGWSEGVRSMRVGGRRKLVIPGDIGYGPQGNPPAGIGPNETLVFDVELKAIDPWIEVTEPLPGAPVDGEPEIRESGLRVYDLVEGDGEQTADEDSLVTVHFQLYRPDGRELIDTKKRGDALDMLNTRMFPGWREGFSGMKVGGKRKLVIPYEIGFGLPGDPRSGVPPKSTVIMDVEVLGIDRFAQVTEPLPGEPVTGEPIETESGLRYYELVEGDGAAASPDATVRVNYVLWLVDGTEIDRSDDGESYETSLSGVVAGWAEGVGAMREGGKRKLIVPYSLGFGEEGSRSVPPRATLIFDVELVEVVERTEQDQPQADD